MRTIFGWLGILFFWAAEAQELRVRASDSGKPLEGAMAVLRRVLAGPGGVAALYEGAAPAVTRAFVVSATRFSAYEAALVALGGAHAGGGFA